MNDWQEGIQKALDMVGEQECKRRGCEQKLKEIEERVERSVKTVDVWIKAYRNVAKECNEYNVIHEIVKDLEKIKKILEDK